MIHRVERCKWHYFKGGPGYKNTDFDSIIYLCLTSKQGKLFYERCKLDRQGKLNTGVNIHLSPVAMVDFDAFREYNVLWKSEFVEGTMLDRTIPFCNTIMKCSDYEYRNVELPDGFSIVSYQPGHEKEWAKLEYAIGDFGSAVEAEKYFIETYLQKAELFPNILFVMNKDNGIIGSCIAWQDMQGIISVSSLHWLVVDERYQGIGLGRALGTAVMDIYAKRRGFPVYIHTQPWSWKAILLYVSLGFKLQKTETFSHYENEYERAMIELRKIVTAEQYELLKQSSEE